MNTQELLRQADIDIQGQDLPQVTGLALSADKVEKGFIFAAMKGSQKDGTDFIPAAIEKGAVLILAERMVNTSIPVIVVPDLRQKIARLATIVYPSDKVIKLAVTGTNGKTSTVFYVQQLLNRLGIPTASLGTIGIDFGENHTDGSMTTPDTVTLNKTLHRLQEDGIRVVALEASSHGLDQGRLNGLTFVAGAFTNLTQDHLDYHKTMDAYLTAKSKLFSDYVISGGTAVLNTDDPAYATLKNIAKEKGLKLVSYGKNGADFTLLSQTPTDDGQNIVFRAFGVEYSAHINIVGDFQVMNLFAALGLCLGVQGVKINDLIPILSDLKAPAGRIESMGTLQNNAQIFVDYAHTPDAIERVLTSLRPHTKGKLVCLMGCGGNRDSTKRPLMGEAANRLADIVYITDDNPRFENPADIRAAVKVACPKGIELDNRERAIHQAVADLGKDDVLVIAGKGHEPGQTINGVTYAMDDRIEARLAVMNQTQTPLWNPSDLGMALSAKVAPQTNAFGVSIDTRTIRLGDLFIAIKGDRTDGHNYVRLAVAKGAAACVVDHSVEGIPSDKQIIVSDTMTALESLAKFARMRSHAIFIGVTGSSGKTTTKEMLKACLSVQAVTHATVGNLNNQIGVPLTLAALPADTKYAIIEMGMNHRGELMHLSDMVRPDISIITSIGSAHREFFPTEQDVAVAKSEIFDYQNRQGTTILNRDSTYYHFLFEAAKGQGIQHHLSFGSDAHSDFRLLSAQPDETGTQITALANDQELTFHLQFFGTHFALDALGVIAVIHAAGGDVSKAAETLQTLTPADGRGACFPVQIEDKTVYLIDDAYNANPSSMAASISALGLRSGGRKIAVLGDMLELGDLSESMHLGLKDKLLEAKIDRLYTVGPQMEKLLHTLPREMQGIAVAKATDLISVLRHDLQNGDYVLIKASHGTGLHVIIQDLKGK